MRLVVATPTRCEVDADGVRYVRARDASGAFGIQPGHADLVTALEVSVLRWRAEDGVERVAAVRGGVLRVWRGERVEVASREVVRGDDLAELEGSVLARLHADETAEQAARSAQLHLEAGALRLLYRHLHPTMLVRLTGPAKEAP